MKGRVLERTVGLVATLVTALVSFLVYAYFGSFVTLASFQEYKLKEEKEKSKTHIELALIKSAICMIESKTCPGLKVDR